MKLWTETIPGNLHSSSTIINQSNGPCNADTVFYMDVVGNYTIAVFRITDAEYDKLAKQREEANKIAMRTFDRE